MQFVPKLKQALGLDDSFSVCRLECGLLFLTLLEGLRSMSKKLFIGGLNFKTSEESLRNILESIGEVEEVKIITDYETGRSKGFGFVTFADANHAIEAIEKFDGQELDGRSVKVSEAVDNKRRNSSRDRSPSIDQE
jgi:RNA recognition motif-containing protein